MLSAEEEATIREQLRNKWLPPRYQDKKLYAGLAIFLAAIVYGAAFGTSPTQPFQWVSALQGAVLAALASGGYFGFFYVCDRYLIERGLFVVGVIVQANNNLFQKGYCDLPGVVCFSTDPTLRWNVPELTTLAQRAFAMKQHCVGSPEEVIVGHTLQAEVYRVNRRTPLPRRWTGNRAAYMEDIFIAHDSLPARRLEGDPLLCLTVSGFWGPILLVPHWLSSTVLKRVSEQNESSH